MAKQKFESPIGEFNYTVVTGQGKENYDGDGYIYQCSAVALYQRKFNPKWRICHMDDIKKVFPSMYKGICNDMCEEGKCFYHDHNKILDELQLEVQHSEFI